MKFVSPNQLDTSNPGTWPIYYKIFCWVAIVGIGAFYYHKLLRQPIIDDQDVYRTKISELESQYRELFQNQQDLPKYKARTDELVAILKSLLKYLPSGDEVAELIVNVSQAGADSGIIFEEFDKTKASIKQSYYDIRPVQLKANTKYANFAQFTGRISALERIMNISDMSIKVLEKDPSKLRVEGELQTYVYNIDLDEFLGRDLEQLSKTGDNTDEK